MENYFIIEVKDNGRGVPEELHDRLFEPSFTTKSSGTGLGLAIAKKIVEGVNGRIWFSAIVGKGSSFFVSLPEFEK